MASDQDDHQEGCPYYLIKTLELYEVANRFEVSRTPPHHTFADALGLPPLHEASDDFATVMQLDQCLVKWEENLPKDLVIAPFHENNMGNASNVVYRQAVVLRLQYAHDSPFEATPGVKMVMLTNRMIASSMPVLSFLDTCSHVTVRVTTMMSRCPTHNA